MSEFTNHKEKRIKELQELFYSILKKNAVAETVRKNQELIDQTIPSDIITLVNILVKAKIPINELKTGINKFLNLFYTTIKEYPHVQPQKGSFLDCCIKNNNELDKKLKTIRPLIKQINKLPEDKTLHTEIAEKLKIILNFHKYYEIKENVLFPFLEKQMEEYRCLNIMWSFHNDIRNNLKKIISNLSQKRIELKEFNRLIGDIFFNMYAIIFREEKILFPFITETVSDEILDALFAESQEIGFPFYSPQNKFDSTITAESSNPELVNLKTGNLTAEQLILIFNHLPVDITFVDENDKVQYFSTPKKRIFTRTNAVIGREVKNCHPPKSVHIVEQIVEAFRNGTKDKASFWIKMNDDYILIQYFAMRDELGNYKGVIEVSQEISEIQNITGENKLLDWEK